MLNGFSIKAYAIGTAIGIAIRYAMAHGQWQLILNPLFPFTVHYQPWV